MGLEKKFLPPTSSPRRTHTGARNGGLGEQGCPESRPTAVLLPQGTSHTPGNPQINQKPSGLGEQNDGDRQGKNIPTTLSMGAPPETGLASPCPFLTEQCTPSDEKFGYALPVSLSYSWEWATGRKQDSACFFVRMGEPSQHVQWVTKPVHLCWSASQPT